ncbi:hypothetical protein OPQ81_002138 [Rhizoctonia solani]|nr:hypothetical protein OPQ81_002138 [Rhizoctonia solani]
MSYFPQNLLNIPTGPRTRRPHPAPTILASGLMVREWAYGIESFSDWINYMYEANKQILPYVFANKLQRTARVTIAHEEHISSLLADGCDPLHPDPFSPYNGYVLAFADITAYISRLLPEEKDELFVATLSRMLEKRSQIALDMAEARVQNGLARRLERMRASPNANGGLNRSSR